jgi:hypothetical protein
MGIGRWVVDAATSAAVVSDGVDRAESLGRLAVTGVSRLGRGASVVHAAGNRCRRDVSDQVLIGGELYHSDGDRERALAELDQEIVRLRAEIEPRVTAIAAPHQAAQWWRIDVLPTLSEWATFREHQSSWFSRLATEWAVYEQWLSRIRSIRSGARTLGIVLSGPEPDALPRTVFERGASGSGTTLASAWTVGRVLLYTAVGIAGVLSLRTVWRELRSPTHEETTGP